MDWIKRNLGFLIGTVVALLFLGLAGWYLYTSWQFNNQKMEDLNRDYADLERLKNQKPHPGSGEVDNIKEAKKQQQELRDLIQRSRKYFLPIPPVPDLPKVTDRDFATALSTTIAQLRRQATNASVTLPSEYSFSFAAESREVQFPVGSLDPLSVQLGEVKAICDVLFQAKINSLDNLQRERVCVLDNTGNQADYLGEKSVTNELAVLTPYQLTFRCFSPELASVLAGFAASPHGLLVKALNVEAAPAVAATTPEPTVAFIPQPPQPTYTPPPSAPSAGESAAQADAFRRRYGLGPGGPSPPPPPQPVAPVFAPAAPAVRSGALPIVLDEKQLKVTLMLNVVKLVAPKTEKEGRITRAETRNPNQ